MQGCYWLGVSQTLDPMCSSVAFASFEVPVNIGVPRLGSRLGEVVKAFHRPGTTIWSRVQNTPPNTQHPAVPSSPLLSMFADALPIRARTSQPGMPSKVYVLPALALQSLAGGDPSQSRCAGPGPAEPAWWGLHYHSSFARQTNISRLLPKVSRMRLEPRWLVA